MASSRVLSTSTPYLHIYDKINISSRFLTTVCRWSRLCRQRCQALFVGDYEGLWRFRMYVPEILFRTSSFKILSPEVPSIVCRWLYGKLWFQAFVYFSLKDFGVSSSCLGKDARVVIAILWWKHVQKNDNHFQARILSFGVSSPFAPCAKFIY